MGIISSHLTAAALLLAAATAVSAAVQWRDAPDHVTLFAPANQRASYSAAVSPASLDAVLSDIEQDVGALRIPGAWLPRDESAPDAFGTAGLYNEWQLKRLFGNRQIRVARGARMDRGRVTENWTLMSPYPSADLRSVQPGTLRLILRLAP